METHNESREFFLFYKSFYEAISAFDKDAQLRLLCAVAEYGLYRTEPQLENGIERGMWSVIKASLESSWKKHDAGKKGGAKRGNQNARKHPKKAAPAQVEEVEIVQENEQKTSTNTKDITLNTENLKQNTTTTTLSQNEEKSERADARRELEMFKNEVFNNQIKKQGLCYNLKLDSVTYDNLAREVLLDWEIAGDDVGQINWQHFMNTMRIKAAARAKAQAQPKGRRSIAEIRQHRDEQAAAIITEMFGPNSGVPYK